MPDLGRKYTCYSCPTKFYALGNPVPLCPKCGADQRDAEEAPAVPAHRGRSRVIVEEPIEEEIPAEPPEAEPVAAEGEEEETIVPETDREEETEAQAEEEEH